MLEYQNLSLQIINFLIPFLVGSLIFFSIVVAPNVFVSLDQKSARKFIRSIFPKLYLYAFLIRAISSRLYGSGTGSFFFLFLGLYFSYASLASFYARFSLSHSSQSKSSPSNRLYFTHLYISPFFQFSITSS